MYIYISILVILVSVNHLANKWMSYVWINSFSKMKIYYIRIKYLTLINYGWDGMGLEDGMGAVCQLAHVEIRIELMSELVQRHSGPDS